jgi:uncharacterized membrane protein
MALGFACGSVFRGEVSPSQRRSWLLSIGIAATLIFILLRSVNAYGEPQPWKKQDSSLFTLISFLNTTKYPPSLHFLLMTMGPPLIFLALIEPIQAGARNLFAVFGRVPFFFYIVHLYLIHALALLALIYKGRDWKEYIISAQNLMSGRLSNFGFGLGTVYVIWVLVIIALYPLCRWYQQVRQNHPTKWWLRYL